MENEYILVKNNETGFEEKNVRALCDVNESTKKNQTDHDGRKGYIGEKGIGFKSVFRISHEPHIFSQGFHFKFKIQDENDKLGFILPYWIEDVPKEIELEYTNILLPLSNNVNEAFFKKFDDIEGNLLLFLRKLKHLTIKNTISGNEIELLRENKENNKVIISHKSNQHNSKENWQLVTYDFSLQVKEEKREGITQSEIVLGFPLNEEGRAKISGEHKVFAYLPTRSYGFKFVIQADFLVPASREDIHKDKEWNKVIRNHIKDAFLRAVLDFKQDENLKISFYNYIPLKNEITDEFFKPIVEEIHQVLKQEECILSASGKWLKPSQILIADKIVRELIPNNKLKNFLNYEYIHKDVIINKGIIDVLGIKTFNLVNLVDCLQKDDNWVLGHDDNWFKKLYEYLEKQDEQQLRSTFSYKKCLLTLQRKWVKVD